MLFLLCLAGYGYGLDSDHYMINADLPARVVQDVVISDTIPRGLIYENDSLNITGASDFEEDLSGPNDGSQETVVTWGFGSVNNSANQDMKIGFQAVVADVPGNHEGVTIRSNRATLRWRDSRGLHTSSDEAEPVEIVEPDLIIEERAAPQSCKTGDAVSCIISVYHSAKSGSDAFDVDLTEALPPNLAYIPGSMETLSGPAGEKDDSSPSVLKWHFDTIDSFWTGSRPIILRYNATGMKAGTNCSRSLIIWTSAQGKNPHERTYSSECRSCPKVEDRSLGLCISKTAPDQVCPGGIINYTINYENSGEAASSVAIRETYDSNTTFISACPPTDVGTNNLWTIGDLLQRGSGKIEVCVQVKPSARDGTVLNNTVEILSENSKASAAASTIVRSSQPVLEIGKSASSDFIRPGGSLNYTIAFRNSGPGDAANISITDTVDSHLQVEGSTPGPTKTWSDSAGTHLLWDAAVLNTSRMMQGELGEIDLKVGLPSVPEHPNIDKIYNNYRIDSDNAQGMQGSLETFVIHSLFVRKMADKDACRPGEVVNYTITYGNELPVEAKSAVVTDRLEGMDYIYAVPMPAVGGNTLTWKLGTLKPHTEGSILLSVRIKDKPGIRLHDTQLISGRGYVASKQRLYSSSEPAEVVNRVDITARYLGKAESDSGVAKVRLIQPPGADVESVEKGSGYYDQQQVIEYNRGKSLRLDKQIRASSSPVNISLSISNANLTIDSLWEDRTSAVNRARNEAVFEEYRYMSLLDRKASFLLDENQTVFSSASKFGEGLAETGYRRRSPGGIGDIGDIGGIRGRENAMDISESYYGSFILGSHLDSYGLEAIYSRSSSGRGFVSSDKRSSGEGSSLRSYEHGSGFYESSETVASDPVIRKDILLSYAREGWSAGSLRAVYASKWNEGMSAESSRLRSIISERISYADGIQKEALMGSSSLMVSGEFAGAGSLEAAVGNRPEKEIVMEERFTGKYRLDASLSVNGLPKYLGPHLSIAKKALRPSGDMGEDIVLFRINVTNDGNKTLAPVEITDLLPENMTFINSSLRPVVRGRNMSWLMISLAPGDRRTIDLRVRLKGSVKNNRVMAIGYYRGEIAKAESSCQALPQSCLAGGLPAGKLIGAGIGTGSCSQEACMDVGEEVGDCGEYGECGERGEGNDDYHDDEVICRSCV